MREMLAVDGAGTQNPWQHAYVDESILTPILSLNSIKKSLNSVFVFTVFISIREMLFPTFTVPYFKLGTL